MAQRRLDPELRRMLDDSGEEWKLEAGRHHNKLRVRGRLILTLPVTFGGRQNVTTVENARAALRRHLRGLL